MSAVLYCNKTAIWYVEACNTKKILILPPAMLYNIAPDKALVIIVIILLPAMLYNIVPDKALVIILSFLPPAMLYNIAPDKALVIIFIFFLFCHENMLWVLTKAPGCGTFNQFPQHISHNISKHTLGHVPRAKIQITLCICIGLSESSLDTFWIAKMQSFFMQTTMTDQTAWMHRLL